MHRPTIHFQPEKNWMNDPNGVIYHDGFYHLFYQTNPNADHWGDIHWGHAKSVDGIHWTHLPIALTPSKEKGELHCFSGCCVLDPQGIPTILYTSIGSDEAKRDCFYGAQQWLAQSTDGLLTWTKSADNPILTPKDHPGFIPTDWRDPYVWKVENTYFMVLGAGNKKHGYVYLYTSRDLKHWTYVSTMVTRDVPLIECPNLIDFGPKQLLLYSPGNGVVAEVGNLTNELFQPESVFVVDYGQRPNFYAAQVLQRPDQKIIFAWIPEDDRKSFEIKGYNGCLALPRIMTLVDGVPHYRPLDAMASLRGPQTKVTDLLLESASVFRHQSRALEIRFSAIRTTLVIMNVLSSADGREMTTLIFDFDKGSFLLDRSLSSLSDLPEKSSLKAPITLLTLNEVIIVIDHSIVEVFINETTCLTARVYPTLSDSDGVVVAGSGQIHELSLYPLSLDIK